MPKITDERVRHGKINRDNEIIGYFKKKDKQGFKYEVIEEEIILKWGLSASTIAGILKRQ